MEVGADFSLSTATLEMQEDGKFDRKPTELRQLPVLPNTHKPLNLIWVNYLEISLIHNTADAKQEEEEGKDVTQSCITE